MKNRFKLLVILFVIMICNEMKAQEFYVRAGGGFITEIGKTEFNNADPNGITGIEQSTDVTVSADGSSVEVKALQGTLGAGFKFNVTGGYMFNKYLGAELGLNYFIGDDVLVGRLSSPNVFSEEIASIKGFDAVPAILLTPGFEKINPYARIGMIITVSGNLDIKTNVTQYNGGGQGTDIVVNAESEVTPKFSAGFLGAVGVTYPVSKKIDLFGELEFKNFSIKSKSAEITSYKTTAVTNGQSTLVPGEQLEDLTVSESHFEFTDSYTQSTTTAPNENEPTKVPTQYLNMGGFGVNIGIRFAF